MLEKDMALLLLLWQEACLEHQKENDTLMPGAKSATLEEEKILDMWLMEKTISEMSAALNMSASSISRKKVKIIKKITKAL